MKCADFTEKTAFEAIEIAEKNNLEMNQDWENETTVITVEDGEIAVSGCEVVITLNRVSNEDIKDTREQKMDTKNKTAKGLKIRRFSEDFILCDGGRLSGEHTIGEIVGVYKTFVEADRIRTVIEKSYGIIR